MADIAESIERFRDEVLRRERSAASEMLRAYAAAWRKTRRQLDALLAQMERDRERLGELSPIWLLEFDRLRLLQLEIEAEIREFAKYAESSILAAQSDVVSAAQEHAEELIRAGIGEPPSGLMLSFARLPEGAVRDLVGTLRDGSPLRALLDALGPEASAAVREALISGLILGESPIAIAERVRSAFGGNLSRALTIARTEVLRSYREATLRTFLANSHIVHGWIWHASLSERTCAFCWAMHGTFHRLDERMATHPNCRCAMVPVTRSWRDLGFAEAPETRIEVTPGPEVFARLSRASQLAILGPAKYEAYRNGLIRLEDLRGFRYDPRWGMVGYEKSLRELLLSS